MPTVNENPPAASQQRKRCQVCHGWGYLPCQCYPGDCICGLGDEECEYCSGTGDADYNNDLYDDGGDDADQG